MKVDVAKKVLKANGFPSFNEVQEKCLDKLEKSLVVSAPTASGKTVIAELFMVEQVLNENRKVIYTCPLRALASEHYKDFKKKYPEIAFAVSTGDLDSSSSYLKKFDVIFTTYEKLASLLRHKTDWLSSVGCVIVDEIHEMDSDRGPVVEVALTQLRSHIPNLKVLGLSATIPNAKEIASWLEADLVESNFRPVKLKEGVLFDKEIEYNNKDIENFDLEELVEKSLIDNKQLLFFANSRKRAEGLAKKIAPKTKKSILEKDKDLIKKVADKILNVLEQPTEQCSSLSECIMYGVAFHHAGLLPKQRELVEDNFREGKIRIICATPTLAAGVNTPADIVVIPTLYRYGSSGGMELISVREYKQMAGRSGRPKFSSEGKSVVIANNETQKELYFEKFVNGKLEPIESKLSNFSILRTHVLGLIASNDIYDDKSAWNFFARTFYAKQYGNNSEVFEKVLDIIEELNEMGFVQKKSDYFSCTLLGKRVSDLFLEPKSAFTLINAIKSQKKFTDFSYLYSWANCNEFFPLFSAPRAMNALLLEELNERLHEIPFKEEEIMFDSSAIDKFFSAQMIENWINEKREQELFKDYGLAPGLIFNKTRIIEWLAYSTQELSKVLNLEKHLLPAKKLSGRTKYGVKEELLQLVELKGIGRVRARKLFNSGLTRPSEIAKNIGKVEALLGKKVADNLRKQLKLVDQNSSQSNVY